MHVYIYIFYILYCICGKSTCHEISTYNDWIFTPTEAAAEVPAALRSEHDGPPSDLYALEDGHHVG